MQRARPVAGDFTAVVRAALGGAATPHRAERLRGGSRKGVYRLFLADGSTVVAYVWNDSEDYWPVPQHTGPPVGDGRADVFERAHRELSGLGIRVPELLLLDRGDRFAAGDVAVVEDVRGGTLQHLSRHDPGRAERVTAALGPVEVMLRDDALDHLAEAAARVPRIAAVRDRLERMLRERFAAVSPRRRYGLIHNELGPDHVLVDDHDRPVLIDIEGARYVDVEWEHVFLELRFGAGYRHLRLPGLDEARLRSYRPAMYLALVAGPLRLLDGDFPHRAAMLSIVEQNIDRTLAELG